MIDPMNQFLNLMDLPFMLMGLPSLFPTAVGTVRGRSSSTRTFWRLREPIAQRPKTSTSAGLSSGPFPGKRPFCRDPQLLERDAAQV
jgi:hypothetical protein